MDEVRRVVILELVDGGYNGFIQKPYGSADTSNLLVTEPETAEIFVTSPLSEAKDVLDGYLETHFVDMTSLETLAISPSEYRAWKGQIHLFKTTEDLASL